MSLRGARMMRITLERIKLAGMEESLFQEGNDD